MKKLLVAAASLAALVLASCSTPVAKANDTLDAADVKAVATENGVVVLSWAPVKDAGNYSVFMKEPGTEVFVQCYGTSDYSKAGGNVPCYYIQPVYDTDKEYEFKVVAIPSASTNGTALLQSEATVSVTTPEAWKDIEIDAGKININKVPNTLNKYEVTMPVDAGYKYEVKFVNGNAGEGKMLWDNERMTQNAKGEWVPSGEKYFNSVFVGSVNGAAKVAKTITVKNAEDEDEEVIAPAYIGEASISGNGDNVGLEEYYALVKATPYNAKTVATTKYAVSKVSVKYDPSKDWVGINNLSVDQIGATKARLTFTSDKKYGAVVDASRFIVYRSEKTNTRKSTLDASVYTTTPMTPVAGLKVDAKLSNSKDTVYVLDDTIAAYDTLKETYYEYYVVTMCDGYENWSRKVSLTVAGNDAWKRSLATPTVSVTQKADNKVKVSVSNVTRGATLTVKYAAFDDARAAAKAVNGDLTGTIAVTMDAGQTASTTGTITSTTTNEVSTPMNPKVTGITGNTMWDTVTYSLDDYAIDAAKIVTTTTATNNGVTVNTRDTNVNGKYYVIKAFVTMEGCDPVESVATTVTITKNVSVVSGSTTTTWSDFSAR